MNQAELCSYVGRLSTRYKGEKELKDLKKKLDWLKFNEEEIKLIEKNVLRREGELNLGK